MRACLVCLAPVPDGQGSRCPQHRRSRWPVSDGSYGNAWRRRARAFLQAHPDCARCGLPATDVDHVVNRAKARRLGWSAEQIEAGSNLQALCRRCHTLKTAAEGREGAKHAAARRRRTHG